MDYSKESNICESVFDIHDAQKYSDTYIKKLKSYIDLSNLSVRYLYLDIIINIIIDDIHFCIDMAKTSIPIVVILIFKQINKRIDQINLKLENDIRKIDEFYFCTNFIKNKPDEYD